MFYYKDCFFNRSSAISIGQMMQKCMETLK